MYTNDNRENKLNEVQYLLRKFMGELDELPDRGYCSYPLITEDIERIKNSISEMERLLPQLAIKYNELYEIDLEAVPTDKLSMVLCAGRHEIPQAKDGAIFENEIQDIKDIDTMEEIATEKLSNCHTLDLYVTGLSVALVAVINVCRENDIYLKLWHYDKETNSYYQQEVI